MRILFVIHSYAPYVGGAQLFCKEVSRRLVRRGHTVQIVTGNGDSPIFYGFGHPTMPAGDSNEEGIQVSRLPYAGSLYAAGSFVAKIPVLRRFLAAAIFRCLKQRFFELLKAKVKGFNPDVVIVSPEGHITTECLLRANREMRFPLVMVPLLHENAKEFPAARAIEALAQTDAGVAVTTYEAEQLSKRYQMPREKVFPVWLGTDLPKLPEKIQKKKTVLFFGRKKMYKGLASLLEAMEIVWKTHPDSELVLAGAAREKEKLQQAIARSSCRDKIKDLDDVSEEQKKDLMSTALCLVFPSKIESFGLVVIESWAHKTPAVVVDTPVLKSYVEHGEDAYVVPDDTPQDLAAGILFYLNNPEKAVLMGESGRRKAETTFNWEKTAEVFEHACQFAAMRHEGGGKS